ncbi:RICIN domain-containing protein [Kibdelosporangium aridum]|uniref:RICIN domain-containing protein n=1 Tax=Kibdelosporangium aridum TaxID=2030 RepID=UPI0035E8CF8F
MGRRAKTVVAGVVAAVVATTLAVIVSDSDDRASGIVVPLPDSTDPVPPVTATEIAATELTVVAPSVAAPPETYKQPVRSTPQPPASKPSPTNSPPPQPSTGQGPVAARFDPSASYRIVNHVNSLVLDSGGPVHPGTAMKLWEPGSPSTNLQFQLIETGDGHYRLVNRTNGLTVDGRGATTAGSWVGQRWWDGSSALQWIPVEVGNGLFTLTNRATGFLLDGAGRGTQMGAQAKQWPPTGSQNQLWRIVRV